MSNINFILKYCLFILSIGFALLAQGQGVTKVSGNIYDKASGDPLAFVNIIFKGTSVGTTTDLDGYFEIDSRFVSDSLCASFLGFEDECVYIEPESKNRNLRLDLIQKTLQLKNVVIVAQKGKYRKKGNPAVALMRKVIANKGSNRLEGQEHYSYDKYEKIELDLNNITQEFRDRKLFKSFDLLWNYLDTSDVNGKVFLPIFLREINSKVYYRKSPESQKEYREAIKSTEFYEGLDDQTITDAIDFLYQDIDIYDNTVPILDHSFVSPISGLALNFYRFYILDTMDVNGINSIRLGFIPRNKSNFGFTGDLYVSNDSLHTVTRADFGIIGDIHLNFVNDMKVRQDFEPLDDGAFVLTQDNITIDFSISKNGIGFYGTRSLAYDDFEFKPAEDPQVYNHLDKVIELDGAFNKEENYWENNRMVPLTTNQSDLYGMVDTLVHLPAYKRLVTGIRILTTGYVPLKYVDIGSLPTFYSYNTVEGSRLRFGGETNLNFSDKVLLDFYGAYGLRDKAFKYRAGFLYSFQENWDVNPKHYLRAIYQKEVTFPGQELQFVQQDNVLLSFRRGLTTNMFIDKEFRLEYTREMSGFAMDFYFSDNLRKPYGDLELKIEDGSTEPRFLQDIETTSFGAALEYAPNKQFLQGRQYRRPIINKYPIITLRYETSIKDFLGSDYSYNKVELGFFKRFNMSILGHTNLGFEVGKIWGELPYTELFIPAANQSFSYQKESFNMMNFLEFVSDQHVFIRAEHFFKGFFFNRIPLLKKLQLREIATFKLTYGSLSDRNNPAINRELPVFSVDENGTPLTYNYDEGAYMEGSIGISNIFKVLRIDLVKRFNYLDHPNVPELFGVKGLGLRARMKVEF